MIFFQFIRPREMDANVKYVGHVKSRENGECIYELTRTWKDTELMIEYGCVPSTCYIQLGRKTSRSSQS